MSIQPALAMTIKTLYIHTEENLHLSCIITAEQENTDTLPVPPEVLLIPMQILPSDIAFFNKIIATYQTQC